MLCGVSDEDLTTLCGDCHDGITDARRRLRYSASEVEVVIVSTPSVRPDVLTVRLVEAEPIPVQLSMERPIAIRRTIKVWE